MKTSGIAWVCRICACLALLLAGSASGQQAPAGAAGEEFSFSFDQVEVRTFVKMVGEITQKKMVVADDVTGKITVVSPKIPRKEVYPFFVLILESAGYSVIEESGVQKVVALPARGSPMAPVVGILDPVPADGLVTKIFKLEHVSAGELRRVLEPKVSGGKLGSVGALEESDHLIVTDTAENIRRIGKIVTEIDQPGAARTMEVIPLQFASARDLAEQLNLAIAEGETRADQLRRRLTPVPGAERTGKQTATVVASPHANSLIVVGSSAQLADLKRMIAKMDVDTPAGRGRLNAIFLKYLSAEEAAKSISALLEKSSAKVPADEPHRRQQISIEASAGNNALLVDAAPADFEVVKKLVEQLDFVPLQVHISVMIAEHSVGDSFNFGVEMAALRMPDKPGDTTVQGSSRLSDGADSLMSAIQSGIFPNGITVGVAHGSRLDAEGKVVTDYPGVISIDAVKKNTKLKILSETSLAVQNNKEATVSIVNEIPVTKSTVTGTGSAGRDIIQNIDRVDVGIKLKLTPHIISGQEVRMELAPSIEAVVDPGPSGTQFAPTIAKRGASTTVTVPDGRTVIIAGLTREDRTEVVKKVPLLGSIPVLGWLFRHTSEGTEKTNLLIFVTPKIMSDDSAAQGVRERWETKTGLKSDESK